MLRGKLPDRSVIEDRAAGQHVVAVPRQPVEDIIFLEHGGHLPVRPGEVIQGSGVPLIPAGGKSPETIFYLSFNKIINRRFQFGMPVLFEIAEDVRRSDQIRSASDSDGRGIRKTN